MFMAACKFEWIYHNSWNQRLKLQFCLVVPYIILTLIKKKTPNFLKPKNTKVRERRRVREERQKGRRNEGRE